MNNSQNNNRMIDDQLAEFTDRILEKRTEEYQSQFSSNPELRALEQTAQRLKNAFPEDGPSEAVIQRMRQNIASQWQKQESKAEEVSWKKWISLLKPSEHKWRSLRSHQRWGMVASLTAVFLLILVSLPLLNGVAFNQPAASGQTLNVSKYAAIAGIILLAAWFFRRKR